MSPAPVAYPLDLFLPKPDVRERFETEVHAPADVVLDVARGMELGSLPLVRAIFRAREILMRTRGPALARAPAGILEETLALGWCVLLENERVIVVGARCQPWEADVTFSAIPPEAFAAYDEPAQVKIAWTLEAEPDGPARTRFAHETRAVATDAEARYRFRRYWRWARFGIVAIRYQVMPAVRREAEARWAAASH
jgi:hypothetical protein